MMMIAFGWGSIESLSRRFGLLAAILIAGGVLWAKAVMPAVRGVRKIARAIDKMEKALDYVEAEMQNDSGKSVKDLIQRMDRTTSSTDARMSALEAMSVQHASNIDRLGVSIQSAVHETTKAAVTLTRHTQEEMERYGTIVAMFLSILNGDSQALQDVLSSVGRPATAKSVEDGG